MVNKDGLLEDSDLESEAQDDQGSQSEYLTPGGRRETLRRAFGDSYRSDSDSDSDEEGQGGQGSVHDEQASLGGQSDLRDPQDNPEMRPRYPPGPQVHFDTREPRGKALYYRRVANPIEFIKDPRKRQASSEVLDAFSGPPKKRDPNHVKLKGTGWAMAQRVFSPSVEWPTKEVNTFIVKHLTLVPEQKKELECDLVQESFLKDYEKVPGYKSSFEYKNKQFASIRMQRTSLVPLFKLVDELTQVKRDMDDTLDGCEAGVAGKDDPSSDFIGWGGSPSLHCFDLCRPTPKLTLGRNPRSCKWMI